MARTMTIGTLKYGAAALAMIAGTQMTMAQCGAIKMTAASKTDDSGLGNALAYNENASSPDPRIAVGCESYDKAPYFNTGRVYIMGQIGNQWGEINSIEKPSDWYHGDKFGHSVGYSDPYLVVGCPGHLTDSGAVYIYERFGSTWTVKASMPSAQFGAKLGESVAMDGGWAIFGAPEYDFYNASSNEGLATIARRNADGSWSAAYSISETSNQFNMHTNQALGRAVAMKGDVAVVGIPFGTELPGVTSTGRIKVWRKSGSTWFEEDGSIAPSNGQSFMEFGSAVATDGTYVVVGAPMYAMTVAQHGINAPQAGTVYILKKVNGTWEETGQLFCPTPLGQGRFGSKVAIRDGVIVVSEIDEKRAYAFKVNADGSASLMRSYGDEDTESGGNFASSVAVGAGKVFIGDVGDDVSPNSNNGAVYVKPVPTGYADACEGAIAVQAGNHGGCTMEATLDGTTTCGGSANGYGPDVWFSWTPTCTGNVIVDTFGSEFDTVLSVHTDCPEAGNAHSIACNDDGFSSPNRDSLLTFNYNAGTRYLIRVAGFNLAKGNFTLRIVDWQNPSNDACTSPAQAFNGPNALRTCKATTDGPIDDSIMTNDEDIRADVWFSYTATATGSVTVDTCGSNFDTIVQVFNGGACPASNAQAIAGNDDSVNACPTSPVLSRTTFTTSAGTTYKIRAGGYNHQSGPGTGEGFVNITPACPCDYNGGGLAVSDIFDYLNAWFAGSAAADMNGGGLSPQDIFDFLNCWFGGCQ